MDAIASSLRLLLDASESQRGFFGVQYMRSGNLWIVAIYHAVGNAYIVSSVGSVP